MFSVLWLAPLMLLLMGGAALAAGRLDCRGGAGQLAWRPVRQHAGAKQEAGNLYCAP
ncbi:hypothetical protein [Deinococcus frigens]|uniref:hypothetical protein n=1 Tax=Deinococcus frigens TaxID=249403 RepID=UPI001B7FF355|nr:hypothetical protein [Deinococcus frigens]